MNNAREVILRNGAKVSWEEFARWSGHRQRMALDPHTYRVDWKPNHCEKMSQIVKKSYEEGTRKLTWHFGAKNGQSRAVVTPAGEFGSIAEAARHYQVRGEVMRAWIGDLAKPEFRFAVEEDPEKRARLRPGPRSVKTPDGIFPSINAAARHYGVGQRTIKTWIRGMRASEFSYVEGTG
jgi:hypothetical protein